MKHYTSFFLCLAVMVASSCNPNIYKDINYFQDAPAQTAWDATDSQGIVIQPKDQISIIVSSIHPELAAQFNLPVASYQAGSEIASTNAGYQRLLGYVVDNDGDIDFPVLGRLHVAGLNRWGLANLIKDRLTEGKLLLDPVVTVEFMNFKISVLGEVTAPGTFTVTGDKISVLEALALAKDLTIYGQRKDILVYREQNGMRRVYRLDLTGVSFFDSPAFYLQQNDVVYVTPNKVRAGQSTLNQNSVKTVSFWVTISNVALTAANFIATLTR